MSEEQSSLPPLSIEHLYTPLEQAVAELHRRRADADLCRRVRAFQAQHPPDFLDDRPRAFLARPIFSADLEFECFIQLAQRTQLDPLCLEITKDRFVSFNPEKHRRGKMVFRFPKRTRAVRVIDFQCDGQRIGDIRTLSGEPLVDFHHRLLAHAHPAHVNAIHDYSDWFLAAGQIEPRYHHQLGLAIVDGLLFENFFTHDDHERRFLEERVLPSVDRLIEQFGVGPLIVRLFEPHEEGESWLWQYPVTLYPIARTALRESGTTGKSVMASWKNHKLVIAETPGCGKGIFARDSIPCGEVLFVMGGTILTNEEEDVLSERLLDKPIEIADGFSIGPRNFHDLKRMPQHYVNHSCRPNAGFRGQLFLMALRDIEAGEQIAYDYAMCARSGGREPFRMECRCEAPDCRGVITGDDWMIPELQERYAGYFQPYLQEKIDAMRRGDPQAS